MRSRNDNNAAVLGNAGGLEERVSEISLSLLSAGNSRETHNARHLSRKAFLITCAITNYTRIIKP